MYIDKLREHVYFCNSLIKLRKGTSMKYVRTEGGWEVALGQKRPQ